MTWLKVKQCAVLPTSLPLLNSPSCALLSHAAQELKLKDAECERLSQIRDQLGQELEELTACLFEVSSNDIVNLCRH